LNKLFSLWQERRSDMLLMAGIIYIPILASVGSNNLYPFAILPYFGFISIPVLLISHQRQLFNLRKSVLVAAIMILLLKAFYFGFLKYPYAIHYRENKFKAGPVFDKSDLAKGIYMGSVFHHELQFVDSVLGSNGYQPGDTMVTMNYADGMAYLLQAKVLFSPICNEDDFDIYYHEISQRLPTLSTLYIIDRANSRLYDPAVLQKMGIRMDRLRNLAQGDYLSIFVYKNVKETQEITKIP
jgi:hypothetical protein